MTGAVQNVVLYRPGLFIAALLGQQGQLKTTGDISDSFYDSCCFLLLFFLWTNRFFYAILEIYQIKPNEYEKDLPESIIRGFDKLWPPQYDLLKIIFSTG